MKASLKVLAAILSVALTVGLVWALGELFGLTWLTWTAQPKPWFDPRPVAYWGEHLSGAVCELVSLVVAGMLVWGMWSAGSGIVEGGSSVVKRRRQRLIREAAAAGEAAKLQRIVNERLAEQMNAISASAAPAPEAQGITLPDMSGMFRSSEMDLWSEPITTALLSQHGYITGIDPAAPPVRKDPAVPETLIPLTDLIGDLQQGDTSRVKFWLAQAKQKPAKGRSPITSAEYIQAPQSLRDEVERQRRILESQMSAQQAAEPRYVFRSGTNYNPQHWSTDYIRTMAAPPTSSLTGTTT